MADVAGKYKLWINSQPYVLKEEPTIVIGGVVRTEIEIPGDEGPFFSTSERNSSVSGTIVHTTGLLISDFQETAEATITIECPTGKTIVIKNASCVDACELGSEGGISFKFVGKPKADELLP